jgi:uncharacterized membrane protein (DUF485 family)
MRSAAPDPQHAGRKAQSTAAGDVQIGLPLTIVLMTAYFGFIALGAFAPSWLAVPVFAGGTATWAFAYGVFVIALGVVLTGVYVLIANARG